MKIIFCPFFGGNYFMDMKEKSMMADVQVVETQGLLTQLALHAGIHQEIPSYAKRLAEYHKTLLNYNEEHQGNLFEKSIAIDSMSVAKTLLGWRDTLAMAGWDCNIKPNEYKRIKTLAEIDSRYESQGVDKLLKKVNSALVEMVKGKREIPQIYKELEIIVPYDKVLLPDYIKPVLNSLQAIDVKITEQQDDRNARPEVVEEIHFSQLWKAEVWMSSLEADDYDVWLNGNNKRMDNWLHMTGKAVAGSEMIQSNPQITQVFLLAIQLFQRPLNVNSLLQWLYMPECPLEKMLARPLAKAILKKGGFYNKDVLDCINNYIDKEFKKEGDESPMKMTREQRLENLQRYLPFDLRDEKVVLTLAEETDVVDKKKLKAFLKSISDYTASRSKLIGVKNIYDARTSQLNAVSDLIKAMFDMLDTIDDKELKFTTLSQWAQSLYETGNYTMFIGQVGCRTVLNSGATIIDNAQRTIWCDCYGNPDTQRTTDFLSPNEQKMLREAGVRLWDCENEAELQQLTRERVIHKTTKKLTLVTCDQQGANLLAKHPLLLQIQKNREYIDGNQLYERLCNKETVYVDNHRSEDDKIIRFDAEKHKVTWREGESFSSLQDLLQNPLDYVMKYQLGFWDISDTEIKMSLTFGNVAHSTIETLFTNHKEWEGIKSYVNAHFDEALNKALIRSGVILLLPEHHLDLERLRFQLKRCVSRLAEIIEYNKLNVIACEQEEKEDLGFEGKTPITGYIDMVLKDENSNEVVFDLKWTSIKNKHKKLVTENRAAQLEIYKKMILKHKDHPQSVRTAFFVMPQGELISKDDFKGCDNVNIIPRTTDDVMEQLVNGYAERRREINNGQIETADNIPVTEIEYCKATNVFPLDTEGTRPAKKEENKYSDYKCFTH